MSLEAQSLSARVSATLQRGLNTATDDLAEVQNKNKNARDSLSGLEKVNEGERMAASETGDDDDVDSVYGLSPDGSSVAGGG